MRLRSKYDHDGTGTAARRAGPPVAPQVAYARVAGWSGVAFALLFAVALVLLRRAPALGAPDAEYTAFYASGSADVFVVIGMYVVPFAGIACLWHMIATRTLLQVLRPRSWSALPHWLHLAAGVVFVCMLFGGSAAAGAIALLSRFSVAPLPSPEVARACAAIGYAMVFVFGVRAAGMYMITSTQLSGTAGLLPRWFAVPSYLLAAFLLVSTTFHPAILLAFPAWVLVFSILLLVRPVPGGTP